MINDCLSSLTLLSTDDLLGLLLEISRAIKSKYVICAQPCYAQLRSILQMWY